MIHVRCRHCETQLVVGTWHRCEDMEKKGLTEEVRVSLEQHPEIFASLREVRESNDWMISPEETSNIPSEVEITISQT